MREATGIRAKIQAIVDAGDYSKIRSGSALKVYVAKLSANGINIIARGQNFNWNYNFEVTPIEEYNTRHIQETVYGKMGLGTGTIATMEIMEINDALPTYKDLSAEEEMVILQMTGDDEPNKNEVLNAFFGCKLSGRAGNHASTGVAMQNVPFVFRIHLTGADYKKLNAQSPYPAQVA